jgi:hypothetical protein
MSYPGNTCHLGLPQDLIENGMIINKYNHISRLSGHAAAGGHAVVAGCMKHNKTFRNNFDWKRFAIPSPFSFPRILFSIKSKY